MKIFNLHERTDQTKQQIKRSPSSLRETALFCGVCLFIAVLLPGDRWIILTASLFALLYGYLADCNDRVTYDETGITMYSVWGKPFKKSWNDILDIDVAEEPLISKQLFVGRVLRIRCKEKKGKTSVTYRFPYRYYIGIDDFLLFSLEHMSRGAALHSSQEELNTFAKS